MDSNDTCSAASTLDSALEKTSYPQMFLKELKCIELKVIRDVIAIWVIFFSDDDSDEE